MLKCRTCGGELVTETQKEYAKPIGKRPPKLIKSTQKLVCLKCGKKV